MANTRTNIATLLLPTVFFGYAIYANSALLLSADPRADMVPAGDFSLLNVIDGATTRDLDALYKNELPHRASSVGIVGNARYALLGAGRKGVVIGDDGWLFTDEEFKRIKASDIEDAVARIGKVREELQERGIELVVVPLPAKSDVYAEHLPAMMKTEYMAQAYRDFFAGLEKSGMTVVDTRSALIDAKTGGDLFLPSDTHWTPAGAKVTARAVQMTVQRAGLALSATQISGEQEASVNVWGDLTKFITSPDYAPEIGLKPENVAIFRTVATTAADSTDIFGGDSTVPVMLVGTSYSANENWCFADYLRQSLSVDVVNVAKEGLGPGVPMLELIDSDVLDQAPPSIMVWEFPVRYLGTGALWRRKDSGETGGHHTGAGESNV
jgi:alginate O-acetyltransferase complex protein AlgJ